MITCPNCQRQEMMGALFCSYCGAQLAFKAQTSQQGSTGPEIPGTSQQNIKFDRSPTEDGALIYLQVLTKEKMLPLAGRSEYTLGRVDEDQPIIPDVDLNPYGGYEFGVSRLHATIQITDQKVTVIDLGSVNGTKINGRKIHQHVPQPITAGDILTLGKMKLKVIFRK